MKFTTVNGDGEIYARCPYTSLPIREGFPFANEVYFSPEAAFRHQAEKKSVDLLREDQPKEDLEKMDAIARAILAIVDNTPAKDLTPQVVGEFIAESLEFEVDYEPPAPDDSTGLVSVGVLHQQFQAKKAEKEAKKGGDQSGDDEEKLPAELHFYLCEAGKTQTHHFGIPRGGPLSETMDEEDEESVSRLAGSVNIKIMTIDNKAQPPVLVIPLPSSLEQAKTDNFLLSEVIPSMEDCTGNYLVISSKKVNEFLTKKTEKKAKRREREEKKSLKLKEKAERAEQREARKIERTKELLEKEERKAKRAADKAAKEASGQTSKPRNRKSEGKGEPKAKKQKTSPTPVAASD